MIEIDGERVSIEETDKGINITVIGDVKTLTVTTANKVAVTGNTGAIYSLSGEVQTNQVIGHIRTLYGDVHCCDVSGDVLCLNGNVNKAE